VATLQMLVSFVVVLGILILVHELGHFFMARLAGVGVERFSIGFGPVLWRVRGKETEYCVSAIPMGGYVKMMGDDENPLEGGKGVAIDPAKAFNTKPLIARFLIVFAGPAMNFILAAVIAALMFMLVGRPVAPAEIGRVTDGGPAAQAGLEQGDVIVHNHPYLGASHTPDVAVAVPIFMTTTPPAKFASSAASSGEAPDASASEKVARTVSPAPVTSAT